SRLVLLLALKGNSNCFRPGPEGTASGASPSTTCAFVPPTPKEETPATRGVLVRGQSMLLSATRNGLCAKSITGLGVSKPTLEGITPSFRARAVLITPAAPAAAVRWPMLLLMDPITQCFAGSPCGSPADDSLERKAKVSASTSMGSPSGVAVPCVST